MPAHVCGMLRHECGGTTAALWRSQSTTAPIPPAGTRAGRHKTLGSREGDRTFPFWLGVITTALHLLLAHLPLCRHSPLANASDCQRKHLRATAAVEPERRSPGRTICQPERHSTFKINDMNRPDLQRSTGWHTTGRFPRTGERPVFVCGVP